MYCQQGRNAKSILRLSFSLKLLSLEIIMPNNPLDLYNQLSPFRKAALFLIPPEHINHLHS